MSNHVQIITAATALVAVVVGPIVSIYVVRKQVRASVVSANRQTWINGLRDAVAEFLAQVNEMSAMKHMGRSKELGREDTKRVLQLNHIVELLINPAEGDHVELVKLISEATNVMCYGKGLESDTTQAWDERNRRIVEVSRKIFKREWERVKCGD